jgi:drug/metabolite transporter (DMT)-like permease
VSGGPSRLAVALALLTVYVVWGSTYLAIRVLVETVPPLLSSGVRFLAAGLLFLAWLIVRRGLASLAIDRRAVGSAALTGAFLMLGGNGLVSVAEQEVPSGLAALIIASVPLWVVIFRLVLSERVGGATLAGVAIGFVGVAVLVLPGGSGDAPLWGTLSLVAAAFFWAAGSFLSTRLPLPADPLVTTTAQTLLGGAIATVAALALGEGGQLELGEISGKSAAGFVYLVFAGSLLAFTAYVWLLKNAPISTVATYAYVNPVVAILLGWAILSEELTTSILVGSIVIVVSVAFVIRREARPVEEPKGSIPESDPAYVKVRM